MKKKIALLLSLLLTFGAVSGCGEKKASENEGVMTITWLGLPWNTGGQADSYPQKLIEERFNVKIEPIILDTSSYPQKKPIYLSSGDIPDLIYETDPIDIRTDAREGFLAEIPYEYIKEKAPTAFATLNEIEPRTWMFSRYEGKNYGLPNLDYAGSLPKAGMWRTDWLKNVGIDKVPETIDEMHEALKRFTFNDPDGNGKKDTWGMTGTIKSCQACFVDIFGAYQVLPFNWMEDGGKVIYGGLHPRTKEALKTLAQWYSEGLIHPDFITEQDTSKFRNGIVGYTYSEKINALDSENQNTTYSVMKALNPEVELGYSQIGSEHGEAKRFVWGKGSHIIAFGKQLEEDKAKLDKILEIIETVATDYEFACALRMGEEGTTWEWIPEEEGGGARFLDPYTDSSQANKQMFAQTINTLGFFAPFTPSYENYEKALTTKEKELIGTYFNEKYALSDYFIKPDVVESSAKYLEKLRNKQLTLIAEIVRGEKSVDAYDEFNEFWYANGGDTLEKEANELMSEMKNVYSEIGIN